MPAISACRRAAALIAMFLIGPMTATSLSGPAQAKEIKPPDCVVFGETPLCHGECPAGWVEKRRISKGCLTGSKV
jgi:hypothetical protein